MTTLDLILVWVLRVLGVLWALGGVFVIRQMYTEMFVDQAIDEIEGMAKGISEDAGDPETPEPADDPGRRTWLLTGGVLTLIAGAGLIAASWLVLVPLTVLVVHQAFYAWRQMVRVRQATTAEAAEQAAMSRSARNGAITSVFVLVAVVGLTWRGALG